MKKAFLKTLKDNDLKVTKNRLAILKELEKEKFQQRQKIFIMQSQQKAKNIVSQVYTEH